MVKNTLVIISIYFILLTFVSRSLAQDADPLALQEYRVKVLSAADKGVTAIPFLITALSAENRMIRRAAARALGEIGEPAWDVLLAAASNTDMLTRRTAMRYLAVINLPRATPTLIEALLHDKDELIRSELLNTLSHITPRPSTITSTLRSMHKNDTEKFRVAAFNALFFQNNEGLPVRDNPAYYARDITQSDTISLQESTWKFRKDVNDNGIDFNYDKTDYLRDNMWDDIEIGYSWQSQGYEDYRGIGWYRCWFELPEKSNVFATDIVFMGVSESAWIWINGIPIGYFDEGSSGKSKLFSKEVSKSLKWGKQNLISVRVLNRKGEGGITLPIYLEAFRQAG